MSAIRLPLSAVRWTVFPKTGRHSDIRLPAPICHPERSEGSRCKALVSLSLVNTGRREDIRLSDGRHQTYIHYSRTQGGRRLRRPGSRRRRGFTPGRLRFRPQSGLVQRELCSIAALARTLYSRKQERGARLWRAGAQPCAFARAEGCVEGL